MEENFRIKLRLSEDREYQLIHKEVFLAEYQDGTDIKKRIVDLSLWMKLIYHKKRKKIKRIKFYLRKDVELDEKFEKTENIALGIKKITYKTGSNDDDHQFITEIVVNDGEFDEYYVLPRAEKKKIDDFIDLDVLDSKIIADKLTSYEEESEGDKSKYGGHICKSKIF
ncbi:hypothetical protein KORDIASMS9_04434 [Kordia sp. SMS9]|uniref:hypothetical protein n=1 Tax=Kordia sp. SMS9 TaxID=2282170 RepID=UPI000E0D36B7|nr:hypothetical protein [Kordia sp. SMS9]AXG72166.1 hypothetical protein KORDIASMS9_04434 [Kordia sp. SMS9]